MRRARHWGRVFASAFRLAGWAAGIATVIVGGSVLTAAGFLLRSHQRTLAVAVLAAGLIAFLLEGSYRVWDASDEELQRTKGRLRELDTVEAKRSYIDEMLEESETMQQAIASVPDEQWGARQGMVIADTIHWESGVRATLRKSFDSGTDVLFDSDEGLLTPEEFRESQVVRSKSTESAYLNRRSMRLTEIREKL